MSKLGAARILMVLTIVVIIVFQGYWLRKVYEEERDNLKKSSDLLFRECMYRLQADRFKKDTLIYRGLPPDNLFFMDVVDNLEKMQGAADSGGKMKKQSSMVISVKKDSSYFTEAITPDSPSNWIHNERRAIFQTGAPGHGIIKYLQTNSSISDSIPIKRIDSAYHLALAKAGIGISFTVIKTELEKNEYTDPRRIYTTKVPIGLLGKPAYQAILNEPGAYLFKKIISQIIFSILLVALTLVSFVFLYRNLLRQKRLTESKNEFISNITHELKTPISTVGVAIEAIRNFNVLQNTEKTGEYLDIANQELKRLALLVDKVLRLSMFESQELDLDREPINMESVANEVMQSMRIQFEKQGAIVEFEKKGTDFTVMGDHLHLVSVIYNLLDNALKYTSGAPRISICLEEQKGSVLLRVTDNGLGIPREYHSRVFEKFFRVPYGDRHNVKGYGLGLSYVAHIIEKHKGKISLESEPGKFTRFNIEIPKQA